MVLFSPNSVHKMECLDFFKLLFVLTGTSACSRVGSDSLSSSDDNDFKNEKGLFLNLGTPSECQGVVTAWHLRYELEECRSSQRARSGQSRKSSSERETDGETFNGVFAVYRPVNNLTMKYELVPGSTKSVMINCDDDDDDDDADDTDDTDDTTGRTQSNTRDKEEIILLEKQERFMIQRDDVIAVCLPNIRRRYRLQILEEVRRRNAAPGVYEYDGEGRALENCNFNRLQTISSDHLRRRRRYRLNLYAEIAELATTTSNSVATSIIIENDSNSPLLNDTQMLLDNQEYLLLVIAPSASAGGLLVLIGAVVLVAGIVVCWSKRRTKRRRSISLPAREAAANSNELQDTSRDQRSPFTQSRVAPNTVPDNNMIFDIEENVAYQGYNFDEHVYAQPHAHNLKSHRDYHRNEYEIASNY